MATSNESFPYTTITPQAGTPPGPDSTAAPDDLGGATAGADPVQRVARGAHATVDRIAESARPHIERLEDSVARAGETLQANAEELRQRRDEWTASMRSSVRDNPLAAIAIAVGVGALMARLMR